MRLIQLNFQQTQNPLWQKLSWLLIIVGFGLNVSLFLKYQEVKNATEKYVSKLDEISYTVTTKAFPENDVQDVFLTNRLNEAEKVIKQLNMPWPKLFNQLEAAQGTDISLLEFTPNAQTEEVLLIGQAENLKAVFDYMARLKKTHMFTKVVLNSYEKKIKNNASALKFTILAKWQVDDE